MEDAGLIRKIESGDMEALGQLVRKHYGAIYTYCFRRLGNKPDAEDVTQEVFLHFCRSFDSYTQGGKCRNYLYTIARNLCADVLRKEAPDSLSDECPAGNDTENKQAETAESIRDALNRLSEKQREVILLRFYHDMKLKEIAQIMDSGLSVTKYRLYRGLKTLSGLLSKEDWL